MRVFLKREEKRQVMRLRIGLYIEMDVKEIRHEIYRLDSPGAG